jgi:hypothetical protein
MMPRPRLLPFFGGGVGATHILRGAHSRNGWLGPAFPFCGFKPYGITIKPLNYIARGVRRYERLCRRCTTQMRRERPDFEACATGTK